MKPFTCVGIYKLGGQALPPEDPDLRPQTLPSRPCPLWGPWGSDRRCVTPGAPLPSLGLCQRGVHRWARGKALVQTGPPLLPYPRLARPGAPGLGTARCWAGLDPTPRWPVPRPPFTRDPLRAHWPP